MAGKGLAGGPYPGENLRDAAGLCDNPPHRAHPQRGVGGKTDYILCLKGKASADGLAREEIEAPIDPALFARLEAFLQRPLIQKEQRRYPLEGGLVLEVNQVDAGQPGEFFYAEVEFATEDAARAWQPGALAGYLENEVTGTPGQSMAAYWCATRGDLADEYRVE